MTRDIVKARRSGESLVVTLTQEVLAGIEIAEGDRLMLETAGNRRIIITKEDAVQTTTTRSLELEIDALEKERDALAAESKLSAVKWNRGFTGPGFDEDIMEATMAEWNRDIARKEADIARKRIELFELEGQG